MYEWLSNGGLWMALRHCMAEDWFWIAALLTLDSVVTGLYLMVFVQSIKSYLGATDRGPVAKGFVALAFVFALCSMAGYMTDWIGLFAPHYKIKVLLLAPLSVTTAVLVYYLMHQRVVEQIVQEDIDEP